MLSHAMIILGRLREGRPHGARGAGGCEIQQHAVLVEGHTPSGEFVNALEVSINRRTMIGEVEALTPRCGSSAVSSQTSQTWNLNSDLPCHKNMQRLVRVSTEMLWLATSSTDHG